MSQQISLSDEMITTVYRLLRLIPEDALRDIKSGRDTEYQVDGIQARQLFEGLYEGVAERRRGYTEHKKACEKERNRKAVQS
jgi:hypothetical protein